MRVKVILLVYLKPVDKEKMRSFQNKIENFFLSLKIASEKKQKVLIYPAQNPNFFVILKKLQELGLILGYTQKKSTEIEIILHYDMQSLPVISQVFIFPKGRYIS